MSKILEACPNCKDPNLAGYQDKQVCNVCGWRSDKPDFMPAFGEEAEKQKAEAAAAEKQPADEQKPEEEQPRRY